MGQGFLFHRFNALASLQALPSQSEGDNVKAGIDAPVLLHYGLVKANILASHSATGVYNIASGKSTSLNTLVANIANIIGVEARPRYSAARPGDIRHSLADISRARSLGYSPDYGLEDALRETIRWFSK